MLQERAVRSIGVLTLLIASTIQGLTPDADSVVSPFALQWVNLSATAGDRDVARGRIPDAGRPTPSKDAHRDEAPDEIVLPVDAGASTIPNLRPTGSRSRTFTSTDPSRPSARPDALLAVLSHRPSTPITDLISSLCRMIC